MAVNPKDKAIDIEALSADVSERFDAVRWKNFSSHDVASRSETRTAIQDISKDLMKISAVDNGRAGRIWDEHVPSFVPRPLDLPAAPREPETVNLNTIEPGRKRRRGGAEPFLDASQVLGASSSNRDIDPVSATTTPSRAESSSPLPEKPGEDPKAARARMLLEGLDKQYLKADDRYHFRDKTRDVAFEARDKKLITQHDTPAVVGSMIDLAEAKGWSSLKLTGSKEFRQEAWLQASLRDLDVSGYQPTKLDRARLEEVRAERAVTAQVNTIGEQVNGGRRQPNQNDLGFAPVKEDGKPEPKIPLTSAQDQFLRAMEAVMRHRGDAPEAIAKAVELGNERLTTTRLHVGTLVEVGTAPYQDKRGEKKSHFVTLRDDQGNSSKVWGVDLPRALEASGAEPGEKIAVAFRGRQPVEVDVDLKDGKGHVTGTERQTVTRNAWEVVQFEKLREDAKASVARALDRQDNPAKLKVFDPSARPATLPPPEFASPRERSCERVL